MRYNINDFEPYRQGRYPTFTSTENGCTHIGNNMRKHIIRQFRIDGDVLEKTDPSLRCDYLLLNDEEKVSYYIELKGSDLIRAIGQIEHTVSMIAPSISEYAIKRRIIYRTGTHGIHTNSVIRWKKSPDNIIKERCLLEEI